MDLVVAFNQVVSMCVSWELKPQPLALLMQCSTEPLELSIMYNLLSNVNEQ